MEASFFQNPARGKTSERVYYLSADKQQAIEIAESKVASLGDNVSRKRSDPATAMRFSAAVCASLQNYVNPDFQL